MDRYTLEQNLFDKSYDTPKRDSITTEYFGCFIINGDRHWADELTQQRMTEK